MLNWLNFVLPIKLLLTLTLCSLINGCVTVEEPPTAFPSKLRQTSVVSTSDPDFNPSIGARVAWERPITLNAESDFAVTEDNLTYITNTINQYIRKKGYQIVPSTHTADYWLVGLIVVGNELNETELRGLLGFEPGLAVGDQQHQKGSLLLLLRDPLTGSTQWRSVVQILTAQELDEEARRQRIDFAIRNLVRPLPAL